MKRGRTWLKGHPKGTISTKVPGLVASYVTQSAYKDDEKEHQEAKVYFNQRVCFHADQVLAFWNRRDVKDTFNALVVDGLFANTTAALYTHCKWPLQDIDIVSDSVCFTPASRKIKCGHLFTGKLSVFLTRGPIEPNTMRYEVAILDMCNGYPGEENEARRSLQAIFMNRLLAEISMLAVTISFRNGPNGTSDWLHQAADIVHRDVEQMASLHDYRVHVVELLRNKHHFTLYVKVIDPASAMDKNTGIQDDSQGRTALDWLYETDPNVE